VVCEIRKACLDAANQTNMDTSFFQSFCVLQCIESVMKIIRIAGKGAKSEPYSKIHSLP
jgi:hypothetical protein